jgi:hypothetical protein
MLQCIIYVRHADLGKRNFAVQHCTLRNEIGCITLGIILQISSHPVKQPGGVNRHFSAMTLLSRRDQHHN